MIFPSEKKKELLRYASRNNPATCDAVGGMRMPMQQPQPQLLPHPRLPHTSACCCPPMTPPPPYCLIACSVDYSSFQRLQQRQDQQQLITAVDVADDAVDAEMSASATSATENSDSYMKSDCSYGSSAADLQSDENGPCPLPAYHPTQHPPHPHPHPHTEQPTRMLLPSTFAATAANMFRNCCGGGDSSSSSNGSITRTRPSPPVTRRHQLNRQRTQHSTPPTCPIHASRASAGGAIAAATATAVPATPMMRQRTLNQHLNALLKPFKNKQIAELLQAVKSRVDPPPKCNTLAANNNNNNSVINSSPSYLQCILIKCTSPLDEEQHVTTCQLFFWSDLRDASELRRLPICPSARDYVYTCCNPLHWYRIIHPIDTESAPPPYQRSKMLRLRDTAFYHHPLDSEGNTQNIERSSGGNSSSHHNNHSNSNNHSQSISSIFKQAESQLYVPSLESFTTDGKDRSACSKVWCQIAYWELSQRVGELFQAKKPAVNIYAEGPADGSGESMCLRELGGKRPPTDAVQNTRLKVGLGVTLSMESGGDVWIYNRSNVPIFVDSPTLAESLDRVCKVMPGYCLKAFDTHRAQWLACKQSQHNQQLGPIDRFSMKISFAKGWGNTYKRQDVMGCPCWLEVHFTHLR
ncbi:LOW QUALITY PROTEIN: mothers against decapentaplegic homolog 6 [Drosophila sulfurigaster albostrigata]|uniref:LOW QUALITY PROTEIN: mothers against decapentaplegic homolog 6 n=1 Tax=Drosophila sulfurigaster albostrigata TaxID=89887 RepID=UPI002D218FFD|nr:LOW QUALITY PROTEIN: mothers against decapentaplegic homolog 6 [Drosophila sulfurigaster albostrigata]